MRRQAKAVNFGIIYGISSYGLSQNLGISRKDAQDFIDQYLAIYPKVKEYMDSIVKEAKHQGFVTTIMNRRRYLPDITSRNFNQRSFAERTAMNTPIQGSAADIIKKAMIDLQRELKNKNFKANLLLQVHDELILEVPKDELDAIIKNLQEKLIIQVHDELILEVPKDELDAIIKLVPEVMENTIQLDVPLKADHSYGASWFDAK